MIEIDGSSGEGGGQILRSSITLSLVTGTPFRMVNIRAGRKRPGLMRQHLTAIGAAKEISNAQISGAEVGSQELTFHPGTTRAGEYTFCVGTAGSATLVFQTIFPALALAKGRSTITLEGGTHNPAAPTFDYLARVFLPLCARMGPRCMATLERPGFYPAGGGRFRIDIEPTPAFGRLDLLERGEILNREVVAITAQIPEMVAERELKEIQKHLEWDPSLFRKESIRRAIGPGNIVFIQMECQHLTEIFTGFGEKGVSAEKVAAQVANEALEYLSADVPVGSHLADQLVLPMALGSGGSFRTIALSSHTITHIALLPRFLRTSIRTEKLDDHRWEIKVD